MGSGSRYQVWCRGRLKSSHVPWIAKEVWDREAAILVAARLAVRWSTWVWDRETGGNACSFTRGSVRAQRVVAAHGQAAKCKHCVHGNRAMKQDGSRRWKIICKVSGSHLPYDHDAAACPYYEATPPLPEIGPPTRDPQRRLF